MKRNKKSAQQFQSDDDIDKDMLHEIPQENEESEEEKDDLRQSVHQYEENQKRANSDDDSLKQNKIKITSKGFGISKKIKRQIKKIKTKNEQQEAEKMFLKNMQMLADDDFNAQTH